MKTIKLSSGKEMPLNGFGTWKAEEGEAAPALRMALNAGYRHIDCAAVYLNEKELGAVFKEFVGGPTPKLKRSDLFITSKVWNSCHARDKVMAACKQSLSDLCLDYFDLYLVHHPFAWKFGGLPITESNTMLTKKDGTIDWGTGVSLEETWRGMEDVYDAGLAKNIGVSNYSAVILCDLMQYMRIPPAVNQCEAHVLNTRAELRKICADMNIHFTMYSILGSGKEGPLEEETVIEMAKKKNATPGQILIAWGLALGCSVLAKSTKPERIEENFKAENIILTEKDIEQLNALDRKLLVCNMQEYWGFPSHV